MADRPSCTPRSPPGTPPRRWDTRGPRAIPPGHPTRLLDPMLVALGVPALQLGERVVVAERTTLHSQLEQVPVGPTDERTGRNAERRHDLVAIEVRADPVQLLLRGER